MKAYNPRQTYLVQRKKRAQSTKTITQSNCYGIAFRKVCFQRNSPRVVIKVRHFKGSKIYKTDTNELSQKKRLKALSILRTTPTLAIQSASCTGGTKSLNLNCHPHHHWQAGSEIMTATAAACLPTNKQPSTTFLPNLSPVQGQVNHPTIPQNPWEVRGKCPQPKQPTSVLTLPMFPCAVTYQPALLTR